MNQDQLNKDRELLKNWEQKLDREFSPNGAITGLEVQGNNLIISFQDKIPGQFQLTTGTPINAVAKLLAAKERLVKAKCAESIRQKLNVLDINFEGEHNKTVILCLDTINKLTL